MALIDRTGAAALIPTEHATEILSHIPEGSYIMRMGRRLPDLGANVRTLPVMSALPTAYFVDEVSSSNNDQYTFKETTNAEWENITMTVGELACIVPIPEAVLEDADYDIWAEIKPFIIEAIGVKFDTQVLYGVANAVAGWPNGIVQGAPATHKVEIGSIDADLYDDILGEGGVVSLVEEDGYLVVVPTRVGVNRARTRTHWPGNCRPHARGGEPRARGLFFGPSLSSPRAWG